MARVIDISLIGSLFLILLLTSEFVACEDFEDDEPAHEEPKTLRKRGSLDFGWMIFLTTGRNPLDYNGYGCHCGFGGKGRPIDAIDRCCQSHDRCWGRLVDTGVCWWGQPVWQPYRAKGPLCLEKKYTSGWWGKKKLSCAYALCHCDRIAALCFRNNEKYFNRKHKNWPQSRC